MMKLCLILVTIFLTGCAQLMQGQQQPIIEKGDNTYFTTCSGTVEEWGSCNLKAKKTCPNGYNTVDKLESAVGGRRELTFSCK